MSEIVWHIAINQSPADATVHAFNVSHDGKGHLECTAEIVVGDRVDLTAVYADGSTYQLLIGAVATERHGRAVTFEDPSAVKPRFEVQPV